MKRKWKIILAVSLLGNLAVFYVAMKALEYRAHINEFLDKYTYVVDEFSRRDVYREANTALQADSLVPGRIVFLGSQLVRDWPLAEHFPNYEVINRGVFGQRFGGFLLRFYPDVIELAPEYVVIELSSYNFRPQNEMDEFFDYTITMVELAQCRQMRPIPATVIPPCRDSVDLGDYHLIDSLRAYNNRLRRYCRGHGINLADFNRSLSDTDGYLKTEFAQGPIDLNDDGYAQISKTLRLIVDNKNAESKEILD